MIDFKQQTWRRCWKEIRKIDLTSWYKLVAGYHNFILYFFSFRDRYVLGASLSQSHSLSFFLFLKYISTLLRILWLLVCLDHPIFFIYHVSYILFLSFVLSFLLPFLPFFFLACVEFMELSLFFFLISSNSLKIKYSIPILVVTFKTSEHIFNIIQAFNLINLIN